FGPGRARRQPPCGDRRRDPDPRRHDRARRVQPRGHRFRRARGAGAADRQYLAWRHAARPSRARGHLATRPRVGRRGARDASPDESRRALGHCPDAGGGGSRGTRNRLLRARKPGPPRPHGRAGGRHNRIRLAAGRHGRGRAQRDSRRPAGAPRAVAQRRGPDDLRARRRARRRLADRPRAGALLDGSGARALNPKPGWRADRATGFYRWAAWAALAVAFIGFFLTYSLPMARGTFAGPVWSHVHGALLLGWLLLT